MLFKTMQTLSLIENRLNNIEANIAKLDEKIDLSVSILRNHLMRVKNGEELADEMILDGRPYSDLSPDRALQIYNDPEFDFILLDVSHSDYSPAYHLNEAVKIPLENLIPRLSEIQSKTVPILVISEDGVRSVQACQLLAKRGYFNLNNISGGYKHWRNKADITEPPAVPLI